MKIQILPDMVDPKIEEILLPLRASVKEQVSGHMDVNRSLSVTRVPTCKTI